MSDLNPRDRFIASGGTFLTVEMLSLLSHQPGLGLVLGAVGIYAVNKHSKDIAAAGEKVSGFVQALAHSNEVVRPSEPAQPSTGPHKRSFADRLIGRFPDEAERPAHWPSEETVAREVERVKAMEATAQQKQPSIVESDDDEDFSLPLTSGSFTLSQLLATGWEPTAEKIFLARLENGTDIYVLLSQLVHIALAGSTRQGKTSIIRQLLSQLCYIGCHCVLLDPHYTPYDVEIDEDWTPFTPFLRVPPLEYKKFDKIEEFLKHAATTMLEKRKDLRARSQRVGKDVFIFIDEYPAIIAKKPAVQGYVSDLLREGGKYKLHLIIASQDFAVKTAFPDVGGSIRDCLGTVLYVGGDSITVRELLSTKIEPDDDASLGKGSIFIKCETQKKATKARTPFTDNESLYRLLGPSTYVAQVESEDGDDLDPITEDFDRSMRVTAPQAAQIASFADCDDATCTQNTRRNEPIEPPQASQSGAKQYRLSDRQIAVFCALYPVHIANKDEALKEVGANSSYRAHANEIIEEHKLMEKMKKR
jgi:hypothetical protein